MSLAQLSPSLYIFILNKYLFENMLPDSNCQCSHSLLSTQGYPMLSSKVSQHFLCSYECVVTQFTGIDCMTYNML